MPRTYKIEKDGGDTVEFAYPADAAAALRALGGGDYRRFGEDVQALTDLKPGDAFQMSEGVKLTVTDTEDEGQTPPPETDDEGKPQDPKLVLPTGEKSAAKPVDTKSPAPSLSSEPQPSPKK